MKNPQVSGHSDGQRGVPCKTVGFAFPGSNPGPATTCGNGPWPGVSPGSRAAALGPVGPAQSMGVRLLPAVHGRIADSVPGSRIPPQLPATSCRCVVHSTTALTPGLRHRPWSGRALCRQQAMATSQVGDVICRARGPAWQWVFLQSRARAPAGATGRMRAQGSAGADLVVRTGVPQR
jgi:hypothetical protein